MARKSISDPIQAEVLVQSRRRCCICFGLNRDDKVKKGQIAHLDGDKNNNKIENLAFLCLDHHDEYDSRTSQSKGFSKKEVKRYREELTYHFDSWSMQLRYEELLNFLSFQLDLDELTKAAVKVGKSITGYGEELAFRVLITDSVDYCDADLYVPHLLALDHFASWGWLTFTEEEKETKDNTCVFIKVVRKTVCDEVAERILKHRYDRGESNEVFLNIAACQGWKVVETNL